MDFEDQDAPPTLVAVGDDLSDEETSVRVPITIVTGKSFHVSTLGPLLLLTLVSP